MFPDLCARLGHSPEELPEKLTFCVEDEFPCDGTIFIYHFASLFAKNPNGRALLVCGSQRFEHYSTVSAKLGIHFARLKDQGKLAVWDLLEEVETKIPKPESLMKNLIAFLESELEKGGPTVLLIDSANLFLDFRLGLRDVRSGLQTCQKLLQDGALLICCNRDNSDERTKSEILANSIAHLSDIRLKVSPISNGFSKDVTGSITIIDRTKRKNLVPESSQLHYRLTDRSVLLIAPGLYKPIL